MKKPSQSDTPLEVIYNGSCPICAREVAGYEKYTTRNNIPLHYKDLSKTDLAQYALTPDSAARQLHVVKDGQVIAGLGAFVLLWREMPRFAWLAKFVSLPVIRPVAFWVYDTVLAPSLYAMHKRRERRKA